MRKIKKITLPQDYGRHSKIIVKALKRGWLQVIMPSAVLAGIVFLGGANAFAQYMQSPVSASAAISRPEAALPQEQPFRHPVQAVSPVQAVVTYTVIPGDTLGGIAKHFCGNSAKDTALSAGNHIPLDAVLPLGKVITITC